MSVNGVILQAAGVQKSYKLGAAEVKVLRGVDFEVQRGEFVAIIGASGSGKSTLLHLLGALDSPDAGVVRYEGEDLASKGGRRLNLFRNRSIGFVFQFYHLLTELDIIENVCLPAMASSGVLG